MVDRFTLHAVPTVTPNIYDLKELPSGDRPKFIKTAAAASFPTKDDDFDAVYITDYDELFDWSPVLSKWVGRLYRDLTFVVPYDDFVAASRDITFGGSDNPNVPNGVILQVGPRQYEFVTALASHTSRWRVLTDSAVGATHASRFVDAVIGNPVTHGATWLAPVPAGGGTYILPHHSVVMNHQVATPTKVTVTATRPGVAGNLIVCTIASGSAPNITFSGGVETTLSGGGGQPLDGGGTLADPATQLLSIPWAGITQDTTDNFGYPIPTGTWAITRWSVKGASSLAGTRSLQIVNLSTAPASAISTFAFEANRDIKVGAEPVSPLVSFTVGTTTDVVTVNAQTLGCRNSATAGNFLPPGLVFQVRIQRIGP
jgi:hypothetical protein